MSYTYLADKELGYIVDNIESISTDVLSHFDDDIMEEEVEQMFS